MEFDPEPFRHAIRERTGLDPEQVSVAVAEIFAVIGEALDSAIIDELATLLPAPLAESLRRGAASPGEGGALEQLSRGQQREHAQVILEELAGRLDEPTRARVAALLPSEVAKWLVPWEPPPERRVRPPSGREHNLASGRPGSHHPLHEAAPSRGQSNSPAVTSDPYAETRLSSTRGVASDRNHTTIAEGQPGSQHPIRDAKD